MKYFRWRWLRAISEKNSHAFITHARKKVFLAIGETVINRPYGTNPPGAALKLCHKHLELKTKMQYRQIPKSHRTIQTRSKKGSAPFLVYDSSLKRHKLRNENTYIIKPIGGLYPPIRPPSAGSYFFENPQIQLYAWLAPRSPPYPAPSTPPPLLSRGETRFYV